MYSNVGLLVPLMNLGPTWPVSHHGLSVKTTEKITKVIFTMAQVS